MSLQPHADYPVPEETRRVARAAFPKGTLGLHLAELLGPMYHDAEFADLFSLRGQPAAAPARLAVATVLQFAEGLSDRQAADAVRSRIDWKYALGLELTDAGFDHTVLSEFRARLVDHAAATRLLDTLLERLRDRGLLKARGRQRTDSTHVLAAVRTMTRLERVGETLRAALNALTVAAPDWVRDVAPPEWYERYGHRVERYRLPKSEQARTAWAAVIAADGQRLLAALDASSSAGMPPLAELLTELPAVRVLRQVWAEQYTEADGRLAWRAPEDRAPAADMTQSPYDPDARHSAKGDTTWVGYKVHFTETCDAELPRVIVHTETTPATTPDDNMLDPVHGRSPRGICCRRSIWSTAGTRTPRCSSARLACTASPSSAQWRTTAAGRHAPKAPSTRRASRSTGHAASRPAQRGRRAARSAARCTRCKASGGQRASRAGTARRVRCGRAARGHRSSPAS